MTESEFWDFLNRQKAEYPAKIYAGSVQLNGLESSQAGDYMTGHALLPANYDKLPLTKILEIGELLFRKNITIKTKEAVLMLLAHIPDKEALALLAKYNENPDEKLRFFAEMAQEECEFWNETP